MTIIMFLTEYFPPKNMNANHNRLMNVALAFNSKIETIIVCPNNTNKYETNTFNGIKIIKFPITKNKIINKFRIIFRANKYISNIIKKHNIEVTALWFNSSEAINLSKSEHLKIYDVMGLAESESSKKDNSIISKIKNKYYQLIERRTLKNSDYIITINNAHKTEIKKIANKKIFVIRDGINELFLKKYIQRKNKNIRIKFVGSFFKDRLLEIMSSLNKTSKHSNIEVEIIGSGKYISKYENLTKDNLAIKYSGHLANSQVYENLKDADICFSDDWSYIGFPTKVFEYMAMGKAIVVEDTPAVREIIKPGYNGLLYTNAEDFEKKILLLANNKSLRDKLGRNARKDAKNHTWKKREKEFNNILDKILKNEK